MANQAYLQFVKDPDQASRRGELAAFIGPNAARYLAIYDRMHAVANRAPGEKIKFQFWSNGFNAGAFFGGPVWFFYRKMWAWAWGITAALVLLGFLPGTNRIGFPVAVGLAIGANQLYLYYAISKIQKLRAAGADAGQLLAAGGVSSTAAWVSGTIYVLMALLGIAALFLLGPEALK